MKRFSGWSSALGYLFLPEDTISSECGLLPDVHPAVSTVLCRLKGIVWLCVALAVGLCLGALQ